MSLADGDLTTVANAQFWINSPNPALVQSLISRVSTQIRSWLGRPFLYSKSYSKTFDGTGTSKLMLPDWPVTSVSSVQIGPNIVQPVPLQLAQSVVTLTFPPFGYRYRGWDGGVPGYTTAIELLDGWFGKGHQDVMVDYTAGYLVSSEPQTVPASSPYVVTVNQPQGICCLDGGVVYASTGDALTVVTGTPSAGQYNAPTDNVPGAYTFAAGDEAANVLISYSFVPLDLQSACEQAVAALYAQITLMQGMSNLMEMRVGDTEMRFGQLGTGPAGSVSVGPLVMLTPAITSILQPYRTVATMAR